MTRAIDARGANFDPRLKKNQELLEAARKSPMAFHKALKEQVEYEQLQIKIHEQRRKHINTNIVPRIKVSVKAKAWMQAMRIQHNDQQWKEWFAKTPFNKEPFGHHLRWHQRKREQFIDALARKDLVFLKAFDMYGVDTEDKMHKVRASHPQIPDAMKVESGKWLLEHGYGVTVEKEET